MAEKVKQEIIKLQAIDHLKLENLLCKIQLEEERIYRHESNVEIAKLSKIMAEKELSLWQENLNKKLTIEYAYDASISALDIDASAGTVTMINKLHLVNEG